MRKIRFLILILLVLSTTGCLLGKAGKGYLTKVCTFSYETDEIFKQEDITLIHKDNKVVTIENKYTYKYKNNKYVFQSFIDSNSSQIINLSKEDGIEIEEYINNEEQYVIVYKFDMNKISENIKKTYKFENEYHLQLRSFEDRGYVCK